MTDATLTEVFEKKLNVEPFTYEGFVIYDLEKQEIINILAYVLSKEKGFDFNWLPDLDTSFTKVLIDSGITKVDRPLDYFYKKVDGEYKRFDSEGKMLI